MFCQLVKKEDAKKEIQILFHELFQCICCVYLNQDAVPIRHAPRRVSKAVMPAVKIELERLVS